VDLRGNGIPPKKLCRVAKEAQAPVIAFGFAKDFDAPRV
jgi:hypothetical protein